MKTIISQSSNMAILSEFKKTYTLSPNVLVGKTFDIPEGRMIHVKVNEKKKDILVANIGGNYYATDNICPHEGAKLHEGKLNGKELTCPWHGAKWDVTSGKFVLFTKKLKSLRSFKVSIENDEVYVEE